MKSIPSSQQRAIARNREAAEREAVSAQINDEAALANQLQRDTGCTRTEALKESARILAAR